MGLEDRSYYRDSRSFAPLQFNSRSMVVNIILINVAIFVLDAFTPRLPGISDLQTLSYWMGIRYQEPWAIWNYLTYGFAHSSFSAPRGIWHILGNMITLFFLGRAVEELLGRKEFLRFYLVSIVVCGIGFTLIRHLFQQPFGSCVGASGGVAAVVAVFVFAFPRATLLLYGIIPIPAWLVGCLFLFFDFLSALDPRSATAWEAHVIGFAFGAVYFLRKWNFSIWQFSLRNPLGDSKPRLKLHNPDLIDPRLQEQADQILEKISEQGEESLTSRERKILTRYSEQLRKRRS
jgi:membrane associated rhomboid family serine protease